MGRFIAGIHTQLEGQELIKMLSDKMKENVIDIKSRIKTNKKNQLIIKHRKRDNIEITSYLDDLEKLELKKILFPIKDYEGLYSVTRDGRIYSHSKRKKSYINHKTKRIYLGKWLVSYLNNKGYLGVGLSKNGKSKHHTVHRLVAQAYIPNSFPHKYVIHKNGIRTDNRVENLEWVTAVEKEAHSKLSGNHATKLTKEQVANIRKNHNSKSCKNAVWRQYDVSMSTYYNALYKRFSYVDT